MADVNGTAPPAETGSETEGEAAESVPVSERLMGLFGLAVAVGIGLIGLDLMTGGALSRAIGQRAGAGNGG